MANKVAIFAYDGCLASGITGPIDVFKFANTHKQLLTKSANNPLFTWDIVSADGRPVRTSSGMLINVDGDLKSALDSQVVIIPGIDHSHGKDVISIVKSDSVRVSQWLRELHAHGVILATLCSGSFYLAEAGLLDDRYATTSWWLTPVMKTHYPKVKVQSIDIVTEDDHIFCSGAVGAYLHLCIRLIEKFGGKEIACRCAKTTLINTQFASQAPFVPVYRGAKQQDELVHDAVLWMRQNLGEELNLDTLASQFAVSERTLIRRFKHSTGKPPKQFLQSLRIDEARRLLETTDHSLEEITERVGYSDVSSFRRLFKREVQLSPADYRKQFSAMAEAS